jgi:hypothetical protein
MSDVFAVAVVTGEDGMSVDMLGDWRLAAESRGYPRRGRFPHMKSVHYFQRFSKREDVVTNNTLLLLARIQSHDPRLLTALLQEIVEDEQLVTGAQLEQQITTGKGSIPDGRIRQQSFEILLETKLGDHFDHDQLKAHLGKFTSSGPRVLVMLSTRESPDTHTARQLARKCTPPVKVVNLTFGRLIEACRHLVPEHDTALREVVEDYAEFCVDEDLVSAVGERLLVITAGDSFADNEALRLYYDPSSRRHQPVAFFGFYHDKAVRAVGRLDHEVCVDRVRGELHVLDGTLRKDEESRVSRAMDNAPDYGWDITKGHRFSMMKDFEPSYFAKTSKGAMRFRRYFDLREVLGLNAGENLPDTKGIADRLREKSWE